MKRHLTARIPEDGKPNIKKIKETIEANPSLKNYDTYIKTLPITSNFANTTFHSVHAFIFKTKDNKEIFARWKFVPIAGESSLSNEELDKLGNDFLEDNFKNSLKNAPVKYEMYLVFPNKNDEIDNINARWLGKHKEALFGTLVVNKYDGKDCNQDVYFPSILPSGILPPKDAMFDLRNEVYAITFGMRQ
ncbi:hypothetical protein [Helicobacter sp. MIT 14-3879]|uniref:hypothetical protein n=1 Tax=Helicobacter sp. MIT 14-3879 TaxID=2040649 RepID=UPI000E1E9E99|nr:hypothetical protein [Helicobacter sp. MIT 14-3879]RDU65108.1 hypothetical protein CQA44_02000 [Helicobacter sp. MIT 14-3879]